MPKSGTLLEEATQENIINDEAKLDASGPGRKPEDKLDTSGPANIKPGDNKDLAEEIGQDLHCEEAC